MEECEPVSTINEFLKQSPVVVYIDEDEEDD